MKTVKRRSQKQEKSVAKDFNAKVTVASGALWGMKADVRNEKFLIECKTTEKSYYSLTAKVWEKIEEEAIRDRGRIPLMIIDLEDSDRMVVFKATDFETPIPLPYDDFIDVGAIKKSFKITHFDTHVYGVMFTIHGNKNSELFYMRYEDFEEIYKEEL